MVDINSKTIEAAQQWGKARAIGDGLTVPLTLEEVFTAGAAWAFEQYTDRRFEDLEDGLQAAYTERARLAAALGRQLGGAWVGVDPEEPDWPVLYIETDAGQMSWHFSPVDAHLLAEFPRRGGKWDGHTTEEKYRRLASLPAELRG